MLKKKKKKKEDTFHVSPFEGEFLIILVRLHVKEFKKSRNRKSGDDVKCWGSI